jgi:hypothetical protein
MVFKNCWNGLGPKSKHKSSEHIWLLWSLYGGLYIRSKTRGKKKIEPPVLGGLTFFLNGGAPTLHTITRGCKVFT